MDGFPLCWMGLWFWISSHRAVLSCKETSNLSYFSTLAAGQREKLSHDWNFSACRSTWLYKFNKVNHKCLWEKKTCNFIFTFQMALMRRGSQTIDPYINRNKSRTMYIPVFNFNPLFFRSELSRFSETWAYFFCERRPELSKSPCTFAWLCPWIKKWDCFSEKNSPLVDSLLAVDPSWILTTSDN